MTLAELEKLYPHVKWREPIEVGYPGQGAHYACRVCIAVDGLAGRDVKKLPTDPEVIRIHIANEHA